MKVEISYKGDGSCMIDMLQVSADYNPQNKVFNKYFCDIETDDFIECFPVNKQDKVIEKIYAGKTIFDVPKEILIEKAKRLYH